MPQLDKTICIAGASGLVGANLTKHALACGYRVRGTLREATDPEKAPHLMALPGAAERLSLHSADMSNAGAFDALLEGVDAVFIACLIPTYFGPTGKPAREMDDEQGHREIVMPTVDGCMNIMRSAQAAAENRLINGPMGLGDGAVALNRFCANLGDRRKSAKACGIFCIKCQSWS